jgi:multidrug resistance efflux pump
MIRHAFPLIAATFAGVLACPAAEIPIQPQPFTVTRSFTATVQPPNDARIIRIDPKSSVAFIIDTIVGHGSTVTQGDELVRFNARDLESKLTEATQSAALTALAVAQAEDELAHLEQTTPHKLDALRRAAAVAKEDREQFDTILRQSREQQATQQLERSKQSLANQREELRQLRKMYEADDLTEETEEIILSRQEYLVASAEHDLRMATLERDHTLATLLPREAAALIEKERESADALRAAESGMPRALEKKRLELDALRSAAARAKQTLADLEHDRSLLVIRAPGDGIFLHGAVENGRWIASPKPMRPHQSVEAHQAFATWIPKSSSLVLSATLDEATARALKPQAAGTAILPGREDLEIPVQMQSLGETPLPDGSTSAILGAQWPNEARPTVGSSVEVRIVAHHADSAIVIPTNALRFGPRGWSVEVKLANGASERRNVMRGRISGDRTQIRSGLEPGQVVITPDAGS